MTDRQWKEEIDRAVGGAGLPYRVVAAWIERGRFCCADLADQRTGKDRTVRICHETFAMPAERRAEIVRQLQEPGR
jgi:hypothetical protein